MTDTAPIEQRRRLIRLSEVERRTGLTADQIYRAIREERFPRGVKVNRRSILWVEEEIDAYIESLIESRDRPGAA